MKSHDSDRKKQECYLSTSLPVFAGLVHAEFEFSNRRALEILQLSTNGIYISSRQVLDNDGCIAILRHFIRTTGGLMKGWCLEWG